MDDHLRILERNMALAARAARTDAAGWRHEVIARRPVRSRLAAALVTLAARLAPAHPAATSLGQSGSERPAAA